MPSVSVILTVRAEEAADLARTLLSVRQQSQPDWELRIVHDGSDEGLATAVAGLAADDSRIGGARDEQAALADTDAPIICLLQCGARLPADYFAAVNRAMGDPSVTVTVAARIIEHGPRFSLSGEVPARTSPTASQVAVRRALADRPLGEILDDPGRRDLTGVAVTTRFGEVPTAERPGPLTVVVELGEGSPPLSVKPQIAELLAAGLPVVAALIGPTRLASRVALGGWLTGNGVAIVDAAAAPAARAAALQVVVTPAVTFLPAGWEVDPKRLRGLADLLIERPASAVIPVAHDAGGSILSAGLIWADGRSVPERLLAGHPAADAPGQVFEVPAPHTEGLTARVEDVRPNDLPDPWWAVAALQEAAETAPVLVDGGCVIAVPRFAPPTLRRAGLAADQRDALAHRVTEGVQASRAAMTNLGWSVIGVDPLPRQRWRPVLTRAAIRTRPVAARRWVLKMGAPAGRRGDNWGDVFFADDLARALRALGNDVVIDRDGSAGRPTGYLDHVVLNLRGYQVVDRQPGAVNLLWIISHPDEVPPQEMLAFDRVYAASASWPASVQERHGITVVPLLQATDPERFTPDAAEPDCGPDLLFVGNSRHQMRPIVADCREAGLRPTVIGSDWEHFLPDDEIAALSIPNAHLPAAYRSAGIVLNDHWGDMAQHGFLNNRLFDAVCSGARVVSDDAAGLADVFGDAVAVYRTKEDLARLCDPSQRDQFGDDEQRRRNAARIAAEHSFLARAERLMMDAAEFPTLSDPAPLSGFFRDA